VAAKVFDRLLQGGEIGPWISVRSASTSTLSPHSQSRLPAAKPQFATKPALDRTLMAIIPALLSLLLVVAMYAGFAKLATRLYRRTKLSWKSAFGFGALVSLLAVIATVLRGVLPVVVVLTAGLALVVAVGAWFLASRATDASGQPVGFKAAAVLSAMAVGMAFAIGVVLAVVLPAIVAK